jgi:hypothetical protein
MSTGTTPSDYLGAAQTGFCVCMPLHGAFSQRFILAAPTAIELILEVIVSG